MFDEVSKTCVYGSSSEAVPAALASEPLVRAEDGISVYAAFTSGENGMGSMNGLNLAWRRPVATSGYYVQNEVHDTATTDDAGGANAGLNFVTEGDDPNRNTCYQSHLETEPWWQVDLGCELAVAQVDITPANDWLEYLAGAKVIVGNVAGADALAPGASSHCASLDPLDTHQPYRYLTRSGNKAKLACEGEAKHGRYVTVYMPRTAIPLTPIPVRTQIFNRNYDESELEAGVSRQDGSMIYVDDAPPGPTYLNLSRSLEYVRGNKHNHQHYGMRFKWGDRERLSASLWVKFMNRVPECHENFGFAQEQWTTNNDRIEHRFSCNFTLDCVVGEWCEVTRSWHADYSRNEGLIHFSMSGLDEGDTIRFGAVELERYPPKKTRFV
jgi:hypothetical protein